MVYRDDGYRVTQFLRTRPQHEGLNRLVLAALFSSAQTRDMLPTTLPRLANPPVTLRAFETHDAGLIASAAHDRSWRAAEACGFRREGLLRAWEKVGDERRDMYAYSLILKDIRTP